MIDPAGQRDVCVYNLRMKPLKQGAGLLSATTQTLPNATLNHHLPNTFVSVARPGTVCRTDRGAFSGKPYSVT